MLSQSFSTVVLVGTMMVTVNGDILAADEPLRIGGYRQLFLDDSVRLFPGFRLISTWLWPVSNLRGRVNLGKGF